MENEITKKQFYRFFHKINKIFIHPTFANQLDSGEIDDNIVDYMKQWHYIFVHNLDPYMTIRRKYYDFAFFEQPATKAFFNENVLLFNKGFIC